MLSMASGLSVPIHNDACNRNLRLPAASRVRLPHAQHSLPPDRLVRQEPSSHGLPGDAGRRTADFEPCPEANGAKRPPPAFLQCLRPGQWA